MLEKTRYGPAINSGFAILAALATGAIILLIVGLNPARAYYELFSRGMATHLGITETIIKMAPILMVSAGLILAFRAGLWNLGIDGQFLIGAIVVGWAAPTMIRVLPHGLALLVLGIVGFLGGLLWAVIPAVLKAKYGLNEIITTLMMNFVGLNVTTWLVKGPLKDPTVVPPQTAVIPLEGRLPFLPYTRIHMGLIVGIICLIAVYWLIKRTTFGFRLRILGENRKAAIHCNIDVNRVTVLVLLISGGLAGLAGANDVLGVKGLFQAEWNPSYGFAAIPLVCLANLNGLAVLPLSYFFSFLIIGGELMSRAAQVPVFFVHVIEGLMFLYFAAGEYLQKKRV
jgi:simple sugar transport system permease protein